MNIEELEIPVPWGSVAAKAWGDKSADLILMVHGQNDNAGTFDRLIPSLPSEFYYVCIDLPGHGKSSHFPAYIPLQTIHMVFTYKIVVDYLQRDKLIIIGHSWGGQIGMIFTQLYPEYILKLILLDTFCLYPVTIHYFKQFLTERFEETIKINQKIATGKPPSYTYDEALNRLLNARMYGKLNEEAAKALLKRALIPMEDGKFRFSNDMRLKNSISMLYGEKFVKNLIKQYPITCPILIIIASDSLPTLEYLKPLVKEMQKKNKECVIKKVKGNHDVHNNQPEVVVPLINGFLRKITSKL